MLDLIIKNGWVVNATHSQQMDIAVKDGKTWQWARRPCFRRRKRQ